MGALEDVDLGDLDDVDDIDLDRECHGACTCAVGQSWPVCAQAHTNAPLNMPSDHSSQHAEHEAPFLNLSENYPPKLFILNWHK